MPIIQHNNSNFNAETKLLITLLKIVSKYEIIIVKHLKTFYSEEELTRNFSFIIDNRGFERFRRYKGNISQTNLQSLFHIREFTFESWIKSSWKIETLSTITFANLTSSVKHFPKQVRENFWNAIINYTKEARRELEFTTELLLIFNESTKEFLNYRKISNILGFYDSWLVQNFHYKYKFETHNKYFNLLIGVCLLKPSDIKINSENDLKTIKYKSNDLVFDNLVKKGMIKPYRKDEFDILLSSLIVINKVGKKLNSESFKRFELMDLSEIVSDKNYRWLFSDAFREDYSLKRQCLKIYDYLTEICTDVDITKCKEVKNKIQQYLSYWQRDYHEYWQDLYPIHIKDLLLFTLGLNVANFRFFEDASLDLWKIGDKKIFIYRMDIDRHHLNFDSKYYLPFDFAKEKGYIPKLTPLSHGEHTKLTNLYQSRKIHKLKYLTNLYKARLIHLFELIQQSHTALNFLDLQSEFRNKSILIEGKTVFIWENIDNTTFERLQKRLIDRKQMSGEQFLDIYYKVFFRNKYQNHLMLMEKVGQSFIYWYKNHYLKELDNLLKKIIKFYRLK